MVVLLALLVFLALVAVPVLLLVLAFWLAALSVAALGLLLLWKTLTGRWPSARAVTLTAGLAFTGVLWWLSGGSKWVALGGLVGTLAAARGADAAGG